MSTRGAVSFALAAALVAAAPSARAGDEGRRVAITMRGPHRDELRADIEETLARHDIATDHSAGVSEAIGDLDDSSTDDDYKSAARKGGDIAILRVNTKRTGEAIELVVEVHNGKDGSELGTVKLEATGEGSWPLETVMRAKLWGHLKPLLAVAEAPAGSEQPKEHEQKVSGSARDGDSKSSAGAHDGVRRVWISGNVEQDFAFVGTRADACTAMSQQTGISCFRAQGTQYLGTPLADGDQASGGAALSTTRVLLGADFLATNWLTLGIRGGAVVRGGSPTSSNGKRFLPAHVEGRAALWFSDHAFASGFSPFLFAAGGLAQIDGSTTVDVTEDTSSPPAPSQLDNPKQQTLDAWRKYGSGFAAGGLGAFIGVGRSHGVLADVRGTVLFPSVGGAASVSLGYAFGL